MLDNNDSQVALLYYLKNNTAIDTVLNDNGVDDDEIREKFWQGTEFSYPNVRIACQVTPVQADCGPDTLSFVVSVSSEEKSSKQSMVIAGTIAKQLHNKAFTNNGVRMNHVQVLLLPYSAQEEGIWRSDVQAKAQISPAS